jgi:hypothetical protein
MRVLGVGSEGLLHSSHACMYRKFHADPSLPTPSQVRALRHVAAVS